MTGCPCHLYDLMTHTFAPALKMSQLNNFIFLCRLGRKTPMLGFILIQSVAIVVLASITSQPVMLLIFFISATCSFGAFLNSYTLSKISYKVPAIYVLVFTRLKRRFKKVRTVRGIMCHRFIPRLGKMESN